MKRIIGLTKLLEKRETPKLGRKSALTFRGRNLSEFNEKTKFLLKEASS
jgi:hypothetical protein